MKDFDEIEKTLKDIGNDELISLETKDMDEKINKMINRRIRKICLKTVGVLLGILMCVFLVINPVLKAFYVNPMKMECKTTEDLMVIPYSGGFTDYMHVYYETMFPYVELVYTNISDEGFGEYDITLGVNNHLEDRRFYSNINGTVLMNFKRNHAVNKEDPFGILTCLMGRFDNEWASKETAIESLSKLPDGTFVAASLTAEKLRPITEVMKDPVTLEWVEIYTDGSNFQGGLNMNLHIKTQPDTEREQGDEGLCKTYQRNLDMLLEEPELLSALGVCSSNGTIFMTLDEIEKTRDIVAEETQLKTRNYCVSGTKEELLNYLESAEFSSVMLDRT